MDYGAAAGTSSSPMPKRVGGGGGGRRPAAARPKMVSPSKAKGIGGVVGGGGGGGASRGLEEAPAPAPSPEAAAPSQPRPSGAKPFMKGLVGFFKQKLSRKPKPDAPASTLEMPDLSRASLRAEMGEARRGSSKGALRGRPTEPTRATARCSFECRYRWARRCGNEP